MFKFNINNKKTSNDNNKYVPTKITQEINGLNISKSL